MKQLYHNSETLTDGGQSIEDVKLVQTTDFDILEVMSDGKRQTAPNIAALLGHKRQYMNDRLSTLAGYGLVEKVGPSDRSGMYIITDRGQAALRHRDQYSHDAAQEFARLIEREVDNSHPSKTDVNEA